MILPQHAAQCASLIDALLIAPYGLEKIQHRTDEFFFKSI
jgi:hypothetical protein